ncbi:MAG: transcription elongation factor GreA [Anaerolineae bacterium]|jgi:transcription elongation factor GreA|nr:transcription elongation factor GreA [Anaerolineae bacterium]
MDKPEYLTQDGLEQLEKRLSHFKDVRRPEVAERLRLALEDGGELTENSEYEDAKNEQAFIEAEIVRMSNILLHAVIIEETSIRKDTIAVGARVTIMEKGTRDAESYQLVGSAEANPGQGKISIESPLGKELLGKKVGDKVTIKAPDGNLTFVIQEIA